MKRNLILPLCSVLALFIFAGCAGFLPPSPSAPENSATPPPASSQAPVPSVVQQPANSSMPVSGSEWALDIDTVALDGTPVTSADFAGNTLTVLNIWATWCPPCVGELPHLQAMSELYKDQGVEIVGVLQDGVTAQGSPDEAVIADAELLMEDAGANYLVILPDDTLETEFIEEMEYFPTTYFLDSSGNVVEIVIGANDAADWEAIINGVLEQVS